MGCGSGILGIAAAKLFRCPVVATDIDDEAARVTAFNADRNDVGHLVSAVSGPGYASPVVRAAKPYDLIFENILARPIRKLSKDLAHHLAGVQVHGADQGVHHRIDHRSDLHVPADDRAADPLCHRVPVARRSLPLLPAPQQALSSRRGPGSAEWRAAGRAPRSRISSS